MYFNRLHADDSIFKLQLSLTPGVLAGQVGTDARTKNKQRNNEKGCFFFKLGSKQRCHQIGWETRGPVVL